MSFSIMIAADEPDPAYDFQRLLLQELMPADGGIDGPASRPDDRT